MTRPVIFENLLTRPDPIRENWKLVDPTRPVTFRTPPDPTRPTTFSNPPDPTRGSGHDPRKARNNNRYQVPVLIVYVAIARNSRSRAFVTVVQLVCVVGEWRAASLFFVPSRVLQRLRTGSLFFLRRQNLKVAFAHNNVTSRSLLRDATREHYSNIQ